MLLALNLKLMIADLPDETIALWKLVMQFWVGHDDDIKAIPDIYSFLKELTFHSFMDMIAIEFVDWRSLNILVRFM